MATVIITAHVIDDDDVVMPVKTMFTVSISESSNAFVATIDPALSEFAALTTVKIIRQAIKHAYRSLRRRDESASTQRQVTTRGETTH